MILKATTEILEIESQGPNPQLSVSISFADHTATTFSPSTQETTITSATTTTVLAAPAASTQRQIKYIKVFVNPSGSGRTTVILKKDVSGAEFLIARATLAFNESLEYVDGLGWQKYLANGQKVDVKDSATVPPINAQSFEITKVGVTLEGIGVRHLYYAQAGSPGVWSPGTPGLNGRATDGTTSADAGCIFINNALTGRNYLTAANFTVGVAATAFLPDILWVNTGLAVATTTAQALTPVAMAARDQLGTGAGYGVNAAILVTAATTNAGAITNTTISYTNQDGVSGRTGTMVSFPATAVAGTFVPFALQAGDSGVRSVQSVTLGTSYVTGSISLVLYRSVLVEGSILANVASLNSSVKNVVLYNGSCLIPGIIPTATTSNPLVGWMNIEEK